MKTFLISVIGLVAAVHALAQPAASRDGTIVEQTQLAPSPMTYPQYVEAAKSAYAEETEAAARENLRLATPLAYLAKEEFDRQNDPATIECHRLKYLSDGLKVVAFLYKPKASDGKKFPLIIFNRGGNREFGKLVPWSGLQRYVLDGFVVLASQYRGNDGGEGQEEFGGADVRDVLNLVPLAQSLAYVDTRNIFVLGWSRGAMTTHLAVKQGLPANAIAVGGGLSDLVAEAERRPNLVRNVWSKIMPDFEGHAEERLRERSVVYWPEQVKLPILLLHGGADWRADPTRNTLILAQKLQEAGKTYELMVYAGDDHGLRLNRADVDRRIVAWFRKHMKSGLGE